MKWIRQFGGGSAEGRSKDKALLGGKGANLAEMTNLGLPVPPGFTITTEACNDYMALVHRLPAGMMDEVRAAREQLELKMGKKLGDAADPQWSVAKLAQDRRAYHVFEELNTYTAVVYLRKVNHPSAVATPAAPAAPTTPR